MQKQFREEGIISQIGKLAEMLGDLLSHHTQSGFEPGLTSGPLCPRPAPPQLNAGRAGPAAHCQPWERKVSMKGTELGDSRPWFAVQVFMGEMQCLAL